MNKLLIALAVVIISGGAYYASRKEAAPAQVQVPGSSTTHNFDRPKKSAHYESNTPAHGAVLAGQPLRVVIDFNFDLAEPSQITVTKDSRTYSTGATHIYDNKLAMATDLLPMPDGLYTVAYKACWPDQSCHDGRFQFALNRSLASSFTDLSQSNEITIRMSDIKFKPMNIIVKSGAKVTWINDDNEGHYTNTDAHPSHTYQQDMNSRLLKKGEQFSYVVRHPSGSILPYHCSAHAAGMTGTILVK